MADLLDDEGPKADLCQYFTPLWVAELLVEEWFPNLAQHDNVMEPCCGRGAFLRAIPRHVPAFGVEIDRSLAEETAKETGRQVLVGDFSGPVISRVRGVTAVVGNPPFRADFIDQMLSTCHALLPDGGQAGFILPAYLFQTAHRVCGYAERWTIEQRMLPRNAFHNRMQAPLMWVMFTKGAAGRLIGFALYREAADVLDFDREYRDLLTTTTGSLWRAVCKLALRHLGGEATLGQIYQQLERNRPTRSRFWREKIRQTLRVYPDTFRPISDGHYALQ